MRVQDCTIQFHPIVMSRVTCILLKGEIKTKLLYFGVNMRYFSAVLTKSTALKVVSCTG